MINLTAAEERHILMLRDAAIEYGRVPIIVYYQHGKIVRIEYEKAIVSQTEPKKKEG